MGIDSRWVCYDCKEDTEASTWGGRNLYTLAGASADDLRAFIDKGRELVITGTVLTDDFHAVLGWLEELERFLREHEGHDIWIGTDHMQPDLDKLYPSKRMMG